MIKNPVTHSWKLTKTPLVLKPLQECILYLSIIIAKLGIQ